MILENRAISRIRSKSESDSRESGADSRESLPKKNPDSRESVFGLDPILENRGDSRESRDSRESGSL